MKRKNCRYYSQHGEDFLLSNLFHHKETGFYVDVGGFDGVHLSNSYSFEQQGWAGICIEPHPIYFQLCKQARPRAICLNVACVGDDHVDTIEFYTEELGLLSGIIDDREDDIRSRYETRGLQFKGFNKITVPSSTLNNILSNYVPAQTEINFISIDVEGSEIDVLRGLDLKQFRPRILVIEANTEHDRDLISSHMTRLNGYVEGRKLGPNIFYARDLKDIERLEAISIDCQIEKNLHPLGEKYTIHEHLKGKVIKEHREQYKRAISIGKRIMDRIRSLFRN